MSCDWAAVPRLTSVGRELLILSRVRPKSFGSTMWIYCSSTNSQPWTPCFPDTKTCLPCALLQLSNMPNAGLSVTKKALTGSTHSYWKRIALQQWGQTRTAVFAQLQPGRFNWLNVPCGKPLKEGKWSICPVCAPSKQPQPFVSLAPLHRVPRWALNYLCFSLAHSQGKKREHGNQETDSVTQAPHSAQQRLNYIGNAPPI